MTKRKRISFWDSSPKTPPQKNTPPPIKPKPIQKTLSNPLKIQPSSPTPSINLPKERKTSKMIPSRSSVLPDPQPLPPPNKYPKEIADITPPPKHTAFHDQTKVRRISLSLSVSQEEARILRQAAADKDMFFSSWAREVLFRSLKRRTPKRPKR